MSRRILAALLALACAAGPAASDDLETALGKLSRDAGSAYVGPVVSAFGAGLNGGWFHESPRPKGFGFDIEVGVVYMGALFGDAHEDFSVTGTFRFNRDQATQLVAAAGFTGATADSIVDVLITQDIAMGISGPTVVGSGSDSVKLNFGGGIYSGHPVPQQVIALPVVGLLEGQSMLPLAAPQVTVGTVLGTMATVRYYPGQTIKSIGKVKYFGLGVQHNPMFWIPPLRKFPFNLSLYATTQTLSAGTLIKCRTSSAGLQASKRLGFYLLNLTPYLGVGYEQSSIDIAYQYAIDRPGLPATTQDIRFTLDGENTTRVTAGLNVKVLVVNINADYNFGKYDSFTAGAMVKF
ncbi:MAG: hypothetical protein MUF78_07400 [Candidatus Edwardsbacteria bacterium]|jgi:hypothetical protein|nr:hypothetical protein [Candidatus Edwardsbacteria bacterium]